MTERVWVTWEVQRRNRSMSRKTGAKLFEVTSKRPRLLRYPYQILNTLKILHRERPNVLFIQNPSIVLSMVALLTRRYFRIRALVMDAHNAGIFPVEGRNRLLNALARQIFRKMDFTLVTNTVLAKYVSDNGGNPLVVPDPLPEFKMEGCSGHSAHAISGRPLKAVFICTWSADEPWEEVIEAATGFQGLINIYITGKYKTVVAKKNLPKNIILTGFLQEETYIDLLQSADFIIVLTKRENCLNCGAYEAVSLCKPLVLSDTPALRGYFSAGAVHTKNNARSLAVALREMADTLQEYSTQVVRLRQHLDEDWCRYLLDMEGRISLKT